MKKNFLTSKFLNQIRSFDITNPLESFLDWIIRIIVHAFIPIPLAAETIVQFRGLILTFLLNSILIVIVFIIMLVQLFTNPIFNNAAQAQTILPNDGSFAATDTPKQNPLGGQGLSLVQITAGFMDPNYRFFGGVHTGVDFVPNETYYQTNENYKKTGQVIAYATMNGKVRYYQDEYGSHTVEVTNSENTIKTIFMHLNAVFVQSGDTISAGNPVGTMGNTGFTTGEHLHYEIQINENETWIPVNPLGYIN